MASELKEQELRVRQSMASELQAQEKRLAEHTSQLETQITALHKETVDRMDKLLEHLTGQARQTSWSQSAPSPREVD